MSPSDPPPKQKGPVHFMHPENRLQRKVGTGGLPASQIEAAQNAIKDIGIDFAPIAQKFLEDIRENAKKLAQIKTFQDPPFQRIVESVMELKAAGAMMGFPLISDIASILLRFLEAASKPHEDILTIIYAHEAAINAIVENNLRTDGGAEGDRLVKELDQACKRFYAKHV